MLDDPLLYIIFTLIAVLLVACVWCIYEMWKWFENGR
jgi:hypothetical protein